MTEWKNVDNRWSFFFHVIVVGYFQAVHQLVEHEGRQETVDADWISIDREIIDMLELWMK